MKCSRDRVWPMVDLSVCRVCSPRLNDVMHTCFLPNAKRATCVAGNLACSSAVYGPTRSRDTYVEKIETFSPHVRTITVAVLRFHETLVSVQHQLAGLCHMLSRAGHCSQTVDHAARIVDRTERLGAKEGTREPDHSSHGWRSSETS